MNENKTTKTTISFRPLRADEIEARVGTVSEKGCSLLLYQDARAAMTLLDETVTPTGWENAYELIDGQLFCRLSIWDDEKQAWITKSDVGVESNTEEVKGRASDAFKRAAVRWGIGRELYSAPLIWIGSDKCTIVENGKDKYGRTRYTTRDSFTVKEIAYDGKKIIYLVIADKKGNVVFTWGKKPAPDMLPTLTEKLETAGIPTEYVLDAFKVKKMAEIAPEKIAKMCSEENFAKLVTSYKKKIIARAEALGLTDEVLSKRYGRGTAELTIKELEAAIATAEAK